MTIDKLSELLMKTWNEGERTGSRALRRPKTLPRRGAAPDRWSIL